MKRIMTGAVFFGMIMFLLAGCGDEVGSEGEGGASANAVLYQFVFPAEENAALERDVSAIVRESTVSAEVPFGTDVTGLVPDITVSSGATVEPAEGTARDFTEPVDYTVTAEDGETTSVWTVTVTIAAECSACQLDSDAEILSFILRADDNEGIDSDIEADIDGTAVSAEVPMESELSGLVPVITVSCGAELSPASGTVQDFTDPVTYTVTAEDGVTEAAYTVTVTPEGPPDTEVPVPGNNGYLTFSEQLATSIDVTWVGAVDDRDGQETLEYRLYYSQSDNVDTVENAELNGTPAGEWTAGIETATVSGLGMNTLFYLNVLVRDSAGNTACYTSEASATILPMQVDGFVAEDTEGGDAFGYSVDVSSDGSTIVAGARGDDTQKGSAYVFVFNGTDWDEVAKLTASNAATLAYFGHRVAISADGSTIAVSAYLADGQRGAVYVFEKGAEWQTKTEDALLLASDAAGGDMLGYSLCISGDGTAIAAGASNKSIATASAAGKVYVFEKPATGGWVSGNETAWLQADEEPQAGAYFGESVGMSFYGKEDGTLLAIGAHGEDVDATADGAVYLFSRPGGGWSDGFANREARLDSPSNNNGGLFGSSVSVSTDGSVLLIGAKGMDYTVFDAVGGAYIYEEGEGWTDGEANKVALFQSVEYLDDNNFFGYAVDITANGNVAVISRPGYAWGWALVFSIPAEGWTDNTDEYTQKIQNPEPTGNSDNFGYGLAISADGSTIVAGSPGTGTFGLSFGGVFVYQ